MKTIKQLLTTIAVLLCSVMAHAGDFEFQADGISYYITSNENLTIGVTDKGGSNEYSGNIVIPEKVVYMGKTYTVTSIYSDAFRECNNLTSITIPNSVTTIGSTAFLGCDSLSSITIPNSVTTIGSSAFMSCASLSDVTIGNSVTKINLNTFAHCPSLTSVTIGNSVTYIDNSAFSYCSSLTSINISDITVWCNIDLEGPSTPFDYAKNLYLNGEIVTNLIIPEGVDSIKNCIFEGFESITSVSISNSVNYIGEKAFYDCKSLSSITIPNSVTTIGDGAFSYCTSLTSITIPNSVTSIEENTFGFCSSLTSIIIPNNVTSIGGRTFYDCDALTSITIPNSVTSIGDYAFQYCSSLASITIPNSVNFIGYQAFKYCNILISITIKATTPPTLNRSLDYNGIIYIPDNTLSAYKEAWGDEYNFVCNENSLTIHIETPGTLSDKIFEAWQRPANVAKLTLTGTLNDDDFTLMRETMTSLTEVDLSSITNTSGVNFKGKDNLVTICLPKNLSKIDHEAFYDCKHLYYVSMSNNITSIETSAFKNCYSLLSITIPNSVISIGSGAFEKCLALSAVHISDIAAWCNIKFSFSYSNPLDCALYLYLNNAKVTDLVIPEGVDSIKDYAFKNCYGLTSVTIPNSVTSIGSDAFYNCYNLKSATIGDCVTSIGSSAFNGCSRLPSITIPNSVTSIGDYAFSGCSFTSITIPSSVTSIGDYAFARDSLSLITCLRITPPSANDLGANTKKCILMVPKEAYAEYLKHEYWGQFLTIKPLDSNIYKKIDISVNDSSFGNINISNGYYCINDSITITATPNKGYHFTQWSDGNTENPRTTVITQDTTFTAEFAKNPTYNVTLFADNGTVSGAGTYSQGDTITITATANEGYKFKEWSDGNTDNPRIIVVTEDIKLTAIFEEIDTPVENTFDNQISLYSIGGTLHIEGIESDYQIYTTTGQFIYSGKQTTLTLPRGIYLIVINGKTHKIAL